MINRIPVFKPFLNDKEILACKEAIELVGLGQEVTLRNLKKVFQDY